MKSNTIKPIITLCFLALLITTIGRAQDTDWSRDVYEVGKKYPGQITKLNGEVVEGYIEAQDRGYEGMFDRNNQSRVIFFSDPKNRKSKVIYTPEELKGYKIADKQYKTMNYSGGLFAKPLRFLLIKQEGQIAMCEWWSWDEMKPSDEGYTVGAHKWNSNQVFQKGDEKPVVMDKFILSFAKKFSEYISDDADLSAKVANKEKGYRMLDVYSIIGEYNKRYADSHK